jgi:hypothetical protein
MVSGLNVIVAALEKKSPTDANLRAALQWLIHANKLILRDANSMDTNWDTGSELWHGKEGFSRERWDFWRKERVEEIQRNDGLDEEVKALGRKADVVMGKAERAKR